jgi:hypothetical protein
LVRKLVKVYSFEEGCKRTIILPQKTALGKSHDLTYIVARDALGV